MQERYLYIITVDEVFQGVTDDEFIAIRDMRYYKEEKENVRCDKLRESTYEQYKEKDYDFEYLCKYMVIG